MNLIWDRKAKLRRSFGYGPNDAWFVQFFGWECCFFQKEFLKTQVMNLCFGNDSFWVGNDPN